MALSLFGERPVAVATSSNPLAVFTRWIAKAQAARTRRLALAALLELDHARLQDIGISRDDVIAAMRAHGLGAGSALNSIRATNARH